MLRRRVSGFTLIEFLVVITTAGLLAALVLPVLPRTSANRSGAANNLKQISSTYSFYSVSFFGLMATYDGTPKPVLVTTYPPAPTVIITYDGSIVPPTAAGTYAVVATIIAPFYTTSSSATLIISKADPVIIWNTPAPIFQGTALSSTQLNAISNVPGHFAYLPGAGTVLGAGFGQILSATFSPTDSIDYNTVSRTVLVDVLPPVVLSGLHATYDGLPKSVAYSTNPPGLSVNVTYDGSSIPPTNAGSYAVLAVSTTPGHTGSAHGTFVIDKATPAITWNAPAPIVGGTPLGGTQLDATASIPGTFTYSPNAGTILKVGADQILTVAFTPSDSINYNKAIKTVSIDILPPIVLNGLDALRVYDGAPKSVTATTNPPDLSYNITYDGSATPPVHAGTYTVVASLTAPGHIGSVSGQLIISKALPILTWAAPPELAIGEIAVLSSAQLNASANMPGTFVYTPSFGSFAAAGVLLNVVFMPANSIDYATASASVTLNTISAPVIYSPPAAIPNPAVAGQPVSFYAAATETGSALFSYAWNFGDSTTAAWPSPTHVYNAPGNYTVTVKVTDGASKSTAASFVVVVNGGESGGNGGGPEVNPALPPDSVPMTVTRLQGVVNFKSSGHDTFTMTGTLPGLPIPFFPNGQTFTVNIGGETMPFTLNEHGQAKSGASSVAIRLKHAGKSSSNPGSTGGSIPFSIKLAKVDLSRALQGIPDLTQTHSVMPLLLTVQLAETTYASIVDTVYSGQDGTGGRFKSK
jgi:hypothetical protein